MRRSGPTIFGSLCRVGLRDLHFAARPIFNPHFVLVGKADEWFSSAANSKRVGSVLKTSFRHAMHSIAFWQYYGGV